MRFANLPFRHLALTFFILIAASAALAQSDRGSIAGTIVDSTGAVVQGATITATGANTGAVYKTTSTETGAYRIPDMQVGVYDLTVTAAGFKTSEQKGVVVQINTTSSLDITLQPGDVKETLTVVADLPTLQTETSDIGTIVSTRQIIDLPLAVNASGQSHLRSPEAFVFITPGTVGPGSADSSSGTFQAKLAGGQNFGNEVILDGASTARADSGSAFDQTAPSVEALQEFKVTTSTVSAEFGRTTGGVESFTTKSGTNKFHGTAYDIFRNEDLNAKEWFQNLNGQPKDIDKKNDYGGSFGGPVWIPKVYNGHDKTFFFFSWEQYRQKQGSTNLSTVPTDLERQGDFSAFLTTTQIGTNPCDNTPIFQGQIFDPSTPSCPTGFQGGRIAFPGNKITGPFSTVAQNIMQFIPEPTSANKNQLQNNFTLTTVNPILDTTWTVRIDHSFSDKNKLFFSFSKRDQDSINGSPNLPPPLDSSSFDHPFITDYYRIGFDHFFSPTVLNHLNVGLNRIYNNNVNSSANGTDWPAKLGISGAHGPIFPQISFSGANLQSLTSYGNAQFDANYVNSLVVADSVSWTHGRHSLRFGIDWRAYQYSVVDQSHQSPGLGFDFAQTAAAETLSGENLSGNPFASFLAGAVQNWSLSVRSRQPRFDSRYVAGYAQDDFKVRRNLMLNIGLRYEVETPRREASDQQSVISLTSPNPGAIGPNGPLLGALIFGGSGPNRCNCSASGATTYYKDLAPRIGFSYAPDNLFGYLGKVVLRGGYAIYYGPLDYGDFGQALTDGFTASPSASSNFAPAIFLDQGIPSFPPPPNLDPAADNGGFGFGFGGPTYVAPSYGRPGMVQNWSLEAERQLAPDLILSVGYIGMHATRLRSSLAWVNNLNPQFFSLMAPSGGSALSKDINSADAAALGISPPFAGFSGNIGQALRPFPQYTLIDSDCCLENLGQSTYHALLVKAERRFRNGLNLLVSYTFSKTITNADSALPTFAQFSGGGLVQNSYNLKGEKSLSYQDIPHMFVLSYIYELPVGKGKKFLNKGGVVDKVLGGWQIGGVQRYQSGQPLSFGCNGGQFFEFIPGYNGCIRFNRVPGQSLLSPTASSFDAAAASQNFNTGCSENPDGTFSPPASGLSYFNCGAFFDPNGTNLLNQRGYVFGNMPRTTGEARSHRYINEDFSIIKRVAFAEVHSLTLKAELINAFNRHVFSRPDTGPTDSSFGAVFGTVDGSRKIQLTLRYQF